MAQTVTAPVDTEKLALVLAEARKNLVAFRHIVLVNDEVNQVSPARFHYEWSDILLNGTRNFAIESYRESAKTQYVLRSFPLYCLTFPSKDRDYIVLLKATDTLAKNKLREIELEAMTNPIVRARIKKVSAQSGNLFSVDVEDDFGQIVNIRIEAYGKGAAIRGLANIDRRPRIVIIDDPQNPEDARSETVMENDWEWFESDVKFLGKKCRIFFIGNNLGEKCLIERVALQAENLDFDFKRLPVLNPDGSSAWPEHDPVDEVIAEREKYRKMEELDTWMRNKMCLSISEESQRFRREDFRYYGPSRKAQELATKLNVFMRTDLAFSEKKEADRSVIEVFGVDEDINWFILDLFIGRVLAPVFIDMIFQMVSRWKPLNVGFPNIAGEIAIKQFVDEEQKRRKIFFNTFEQEQGTQKEGRIIALSPRLRQHKIFFPDDAPWVREAENEFMMFPRGLHDDIPDTMASNDQESFAPVSQRQAADLPRYGIGD